MKSGGDARSPGASASIASAWIWSGISGGSASYTSRWRASAGSLIVAEFESLEAARAWIEQDPYVTEGVFAHVEVHPFVQVGP